MSASDRRAWWVGLLLVAGLAVWVRIGQLPQVFVEGEVLPASADAQYHLHRITRTLASFPRVPVLDTYLNWPYGAACPWPAGFDLAGAALVKLLRMEDRPGAAASLLPPLLGLALVLSVAGVARRLSPAGSAGVAGGLAAGIAAAVLPQAVAISRIARVDHHVAEALVMLGLGACALALARVEAGAPADPRAGLRARWRIEGALGAVAFLAGCVFTGAPLYVAIAALLVSGVRLLGRGTPLGWPALAGSGAPGLAAAGLLLGIANGATALLHGFAFDYRFPSLFQPALYGIAAAGCLAAAGVSTLFRDEPSPRARAMRRLLALGLVAGAPSALAFAVLPALRDAVGAGLADWLARRDPWLGSIDEFQPLFAGAPWRPAAWARVVEYYGAFGLLAPVALPIAIWRAWRRAPAAGGVFAAWTLALLGLTLLQSRFGRLFGLNLAIAWGLVFGEAAARALRPLLARGVGARGVVLAAPGALGALGARLGPAGAAAAFVALGLAALCAADPALRARLRWSVPRAPSAIEAAALYLRESAAAERAGAATPGDSGVLTEWSFGHTIIWVAGRPVVAAGFGDFTGREGFAAVQGYPFGSAADLDALMEARRLRHLVTGSVSFLQRIASPAARDPFVSGAGRRVHVNPAYFRSLRLANLMLGGSGVPELDVPHLERLWPRHASSQTVAGLATPVPALFVYERVRGAELRGHAAPGTRVTARIELAWGEHRAPWIAWTHTDAGGAFRLMLPIPSGVDTPVRGAVGSTAHYQLSIGDAEPMSLRVSEEDVRAGRAIALEGAEVSSAVADRS